MRSEEERNPVDTNTGPLQGKTILITRPKEQAEEFARLLADKGARLLFVPTIRIAPPQDWDQCDGAIRTLKVYDGIVFTSANAARYFFQRAAGNGTQETQTTLKHKPIYVVGDKTGDAVSKEGFSPTAFPGVHDAQELALALANRSPKGKRFLFPRGDLAGNDLAGVLKPAGATIDEIIVYETLAPRDEDAKFIRERLASETIDVATFFSPSSVRNLLATVEREMLVSCVIAAIGASTASAIEECGFHVGIIAAKPSAADLAEAIVRYYTAKS